VLKAIVDTSTYLDIRRATKNSRALWAQCTLKNLLAYRAVFPNLTISALKAYEILDGLYRGPALSAPHEFLVKVLPSYEVIYPDEQIIALGAEINAALASSRLTIGLADTMIAATAIARKLTLVNANSKHFFRVKAHGFPITLENWRVD